MKAPQTLGHIISALVGSQVELGENGVTGTCKRGQVMSAFKNGFLKKRPINVGRH